jgi:hypothetical protein
MSSFRGSDEELDREIGAVLGILDVRRRRVSAEVRALQRDLEELVRERRRRKGEGIPAGPGASAPVPA